MKTFATWALGGLLGLSSISALACTPEEAIAKGEHLAQLIYDRTKDQPGKAEAVPTSVAVKWPPGRDDAQARLLENGIGGFGEEGTLQRMEEDDRLPFGIAHLFPRDRSGGGGQQIGADVRCGNRAFRAFLQRADEACVK